MSKNSKVLFICKKRIESYGISFGLLNSASFIANALQKKGIESKAICVIDNNYIDKEIHDYRPTHVIIHALWVVPEKIKILIEKYPRIKWVVRIHSQLPFLANEGIAFDWICKYNELAKSHSNFRLSGNNRTFNDDIVKLGIKSVYLPNIYCPKNKTKCEKTKKDDYLDVACFGALRPMKNHLTQAVAAIHFANRKDTKMRFHINGNRIEQKGDQPLKNLKALFKKTPHKLVEHDWMNHVDFLKLIRTMDLGMQVSLSESFNIVSADFVNSCVPIVVSDEMDWLPKWTHADENSTESIVRKMDSNLFWNKITFGLTTKINRLYLRCYNKRALKVWLRYLKY